jgi:hypothetical protein
MDVAVVFIDRGGDGRDHPVHVALAGCPAVLRTADWTSQSVELPDGAVAARFTLNRSASANVLTDQRSAPQRSRIRAAAAEETEGRGEGRVAIPTVNTATTVLPLTMKRRRKNGAVMRCSP